MSFGKSIVTRRLPKTGQTTEFTPNDDGTYEAGFGGTRFVDNGDGTVTDNSTGLMWVKQPAIMIPGSTGQIARIRSNWATATAYVVGDAVTAIVQEISAATVSINGTTKVATITPNGSGVTFTAADVGRTLQWTDDTATGRYQIVTVNSTTEAILESSVACTNKTFTLKSVFVCLVAHTSSEATFGAETQANWQETHWGRQGTDDALDHDDVDLITTGNPTTILGTGPSSIKTGILVTFANVAGADAAELNGVTFVATYVDTSNFTIPLNSTGMTFTDDDAGEIRTITPHKMTWAQAILDCEALTYCGHADWRMPNLAEVMSLLDYSQGVVADPPRHQLPFDGLMYLNGLTDVLDFWSATSNDVAGVATAAWSVRFKAANTTLTSAATKTGFANVRFVRPVRTIIRVA